MALAQSISAEASARATSVHLPGLGEAPISSPRWLLAGASVPLLVGFCVNLLQVLMTQQRQWLSPGSKEGTTEPFMTTLGGQAPAIALCSVH